MIHKTPRLRVGSWFGRQFNVFKLVMLVFWAGFGSSWGWKNDLDDSLTLLSCFIAGSDPSYDDILGRFWMPISHGSWIPRELHAFKPFYVSILWWVWKLLKAKNWFWRQFHVLKRVCGSPGSPWPPLIPFVKCWLQKGPQNLKLLKRGQ